MMTNEGNTYDPGLKPRPDSEMEDVLLPNEGPWSLTYLIVSLSLVDRFISRSSILTRELDRAHALPCSSNLLNDLT